MLQTKAVKQSKHAFYSNNFFKSCRLWDNVEKYRKAWLATDDNKTQPHCMLNT